MTASTDVQETTINTIRTLSMDAVQAANSGHPGTPMALAPVAYSLWANFLNFDPANPRWAYGNGSLAEPPPTESSDSENLTAGSQLGLPTQQHWRVGFNTYGNPRPERPPTWSRSRQRAWKVPLTLLLVLVDDAKRPPQKMA